MANAEENTPRDIPSDEVPVAHGNADAGQQSPQESDEEPAVYGLERRGSGWAVQRRDFLALAGSAGVVAGGVVAPETSSMAEAAAPDAKLANQLFLAHTDDVTALAISPNGLLLLSGSRDKSIKMWSLPEGAFLKPFASHEERVEALVVNPSGDRLVSAGTDQAVNLWALPDGELLAELDGHGQGVHDLAFSPNGQMLAVAQPGNIVELWTANKELPHTLRGHTLPVHAVAFTPDSRQVISAGAEDVIRFWSTETGEQVRTLRANYGTITALALHPDGDTLAIGTERKTIALVSLILGRYLTTLYGHTGKVLSLAYTPQGDLLASGGSDRAILLWSMERRRMVATLMDIDATPPTTKGVSYKVEAAPGYWITYTLPCGSKIPEGAVCVCNCVPGTWTGPLMASETRALPIPSQETYQVPVEEKTTETRTTPRTETRPVPAPRPRPERVERTSRPPRTRGMDNDLLGGNYRNRNRNQGMSGGLPPAAPPTRTIPGSHYWFPN